MKGSLSIRKTFPLIVLAATLVLPVSVLARDHDRSAGSVTIGYSDHYVYPGRHYAPGHRGHGARHSRYYAPSCPHTYYRPYTRVYYEPRYYVPGYYGYGDNGWDIALRYHFSDR